VTDEEIFNLKAYRSKVIGQIRRTKDDDQLKMMLSLLREMLDTLIDGGPIKPKDIKDQVDLIAKYRAKKAT
jgi:hemerythrin-like domain-containing protein